MAFTYADSPATIIRDAIRFLIGDTDANDSSKHLSDGELLFITQRYGFADITASYDTTTDQLSLLQMAEEAALALAGKYASEASYAQGGMSESANQKSEETRNRARQLRKMWTRAAYPRAGGRSLADKEVAADTEDLVQAVFKKGMFDNVFLDQS